jgi:hypothetical protein
MNTSLQWLDILYMRWVIWHVNNETLPAVRTTAVRECSYIYFLFENLVLHSPHRAHHPDSHSACYMKPAANKCCCETCPKCANSIITISTQLFIQYATMLRPQEEVPCFNRIYNSLELLLPSLVYVSVFPSSHVAIMFMWILYEHEKLHSSKCFGPVDIDHSGVWMEMKH